MRPLVIVASLALVLAACAPAQPTGASPAPGSPAAAATAAPTPKQGGTIRITTNQEPDTLNPLFGGGLRVSNTVMQAVFNGLWVVNERGEFEPALAAEVPTVANGGVSADGKTITVKLRKDVKWADGKPFTAHDVKFNFDAALSPDTPGGKRTVQNFESFTVKDDFTMEWKFKQLYPAYLLLWSYPSGIVPKHAFDGVAMKDLAKHDFGRKPFGTGPFRVTEWQATRRRGSRSSRGSSSSSRSCRSTSSATASATPSTRARPRPADRHALCARSGPGGDPHAPA